MSLSDVLANASLFPNRNIFDYMCFRLYVSILKFFAISGNFDYMCQHAGEAGGKFFDYRCQFSWIFCVFFRRRRRRRKNFDYVCQKYFQIVIFLIICAFDYMCQLLIPAGHFRLYVSHI